MAKHSINRKSASSSAPTSMEPAFAPSFVADSPVSNSGVGDIFTAPGLTDPIAARQWHLNRIGDVARVWEDFTGKGVTVGVYDSGVEFGHADLAANYDASLHITVRGRTYDGDWQSHSGPHGTSVAGLIGAARNGIGTVGVAYDATLASVNIFDRYSGGGRDPGIWVNAPNPTLFYEAMRQSYTFDVVNHSWGGQPVFGTEGSRMVAGTRTNRLVEGVRYAAENGRDGLGTISVVAAGNDKFDIAGESSMTDRHWIPVAAHRELDGLASLYSRRGAGLLVSAPSDDAWQIGGTGMVATDITGRDGYNIGQDPGGAHDYTDMFGGTSVAAPVVSGVVALMLDANEGLGWRDVQNIIASSARMPVAFDSFRGTYTFNGQDFLLNESRFRLSNDNGASNGGGHHFSTDYGYGAIDSHAAVRMAEIWSLFGPAATSRNERSADTGVLAVNQAYVGQGGFIEESKHNDFTATPGSVTIRMAENIDVEHVDVTFDYSVFVDRQDGNPQYQTLGTQMFKLIAPDGTEAFVDDGSGTGFVSPIQSFTFGLRNFRGTESQGDWKFQFQERYEDTTLTIHNVRMQVYGAAVTSDDVYSYTDEFFTMAAIAGEEGRRTLSDTNGGVDWVNAAAVTADVELSLLSGATTRFGGQDAFTIARGSLIEHAVAGDGDDRLFGNALDNRLYGMRGDDWLNGGAGNDTLFGGQGNDVFAFDTAGVSGRDKVLDWSAGDRIATSKMLRGADQNGVLTVGSSALLLLDGMARGDTAELEGQGGATLQALGRSDGYWWYGFLSEGDEDFVDGRVSELALGQTGRPAGGSIPAADTGMADASGGDAMKSTAFFLYDTMGDAMASGVQTWA